MFSVVEINLLLSSKFKTVGNGIYSYSRHFESLGGLGQSTEFVEKLLSSLCIMFI